MYAYIYKSGKIITKLLTLFSLGVTFFSALFYLIFYYKPTSSFLIRKK